MSLLQCNATERNGKSQHASNNRSTNFRVVFLLLWFLFVFTQRCVFSREEEREREKENELENMTMYFRCSLWWSNDFSSFQCDERAFRQKHSASLSVCSFQFHCIVNHHFRFSHCHITCVSHRVRLTLVASCKTFSSVILSWFLFK